VPRHRDHPGLQRAYGEALPIAEQMIELVAVGREFRLQVEQALEDALHLGDPATHGKASAQLFAQPAGGAQVVRMGVRFQDPLHCELLAQHEVDDALRRGGRRAARARIEVQHRIDDRAGAAPSGVHDVAHGSRGGVEEGLHLGLHV